MSAPWVAFFAMLVITRDIGLALLVAGVVYLLTDDDWRSRNAKR